MKLTSKTGRALSAAIIAGSVAAAVIPSTAEAGRRTGTAVGVGLAAGALGLALGASAANARGRDEVYYDDAPRYRRVRTARCWYEDRERENRFGEVRVYRVRICN